MARGTADVELAEHGKQGLLESILNPNAAISPEYKVWMIATQGGSYLSGYVRTETDTHIELVESTGDTHRLAKSGITEAFPSQLSLMPSGLSAGMSIEELVDLVEYLATLR